MTNKERVIKGLESLHDRLLDAAKQYVIATLDASMVADALALLKEQPDIVRCGDCKYYSNGFCYNPNTFDEKTCGNTVPDWFCADGERAVKQE